ncbi:ATP synthase F0 subunit B [Thermodesulfatator atlanticus]|uniref:ATP synthase F0 subunit B n=1 Tax=Thermodesulfatator atlanticus TaxID=501497 RepID=UPI0003B7401E|nr:ATP synthase F0 subunit B [Thermodesulfatator atlanticus]
MLKFDITLFIQIVEALIMTAILNVIFIKPVMQIFKERKEKFDGLRSDIERFTKGAEEVLQQYQQRLQEARMEASRKREELKQAAKAEEKKILEAATKEAEELKQKTLSQLAQQLQQVRQALQSQVETFAVSIAQKLLGRSL